MWTNHRVTPPLRYTFESIVNYWFQTAFADVLAKIAGRDFYTIPSATPRATRATTSFLTSDKLLFYAQNLPTCLTERRWSRDRSSRLTWWTSPPLSVVRLDSLKNSASSFLPLSGSPCVFSVGTPKILRFRSNCFAALSPHPMIASKWISVTSALIQHLIFTWLMK